MKQRQNLSSHNPLNRSFTLASLLRFAAPAIGMMLTLSLYSIIDGIFIGRFVGDTALAASNIVYPAFNLVLGIAIMLASGGSALVAKTLGEQLPDKASQYFTQLLLAAFCIGIFLEIFIFGFSTPLLQLLGAKGAMLAPAQDYLKSMMLFTPFFIVKAIFDNFFIADGRPLFGFLVSLASGLANTLLDALFICVFGCGIFGAGLATGLANVLASLAGLIYFKYFSRGLHFCRFHFHFTVLRQASSNGISEMVTQLSVGITTYLFNLITFAWAGESGVAAISIIFYVEMLLTSAYLGFTNGVAPIFSYQYGARSFPELQKLTRLSLTFILPTAFLSFTAAHFFAAPLIQLFLPHAGHAYALTLQGFRLFSFSFLLCGFNIFTIGFFTAISHGRLSALCSFARNLAGIVCFLLILPKFLGINGIWLAVPAADLCVLLLSLYLLHEQDREFQQKNSLQKKIQQLPPYCP